MMSPFLTGFCTELTKLAGYGDAAPNTQAGGKITGPVVGSNVYNLNKQEHYRPGPGYKLRPTAPPAAAAPVKTNRGGGGGQNKPPAGNPYHKRFVYPDGERNNKPPTSLNVQPKPKAPIIAHKYTSSTQTSATKRTKNMTPGQTSDYASRNPAASGDINSMGARTNSDGSATRYSSTTHGSRI